MADDVWILGIHMTKFGKHPDKDVIDLAAEAAMGALADGGVTMKDMGILAAGNLMGGAAPIGPDAAEADRPDRHPRVQRVERLRHRRHRAAHGDHGGQGRRDRLRASPSASRSSSGAGLLGGGGRPKSDDDTWKPHGRYGAVASSTGASAPRRCRACSPRSA